MFIDGDTSNKSRLPTAKQADATFPPNTVMRQIAESDTIIMSWAEKLLAETKNVVDIGGRTDALNKHGHD